MQLVKYRKFQCINNSADGIDNAAGKQPAKCCRGQRLYDVREGENAEPSHHNIDAGGNPFRAVNPEDTLQNANQGNAPDKHKQQHAGSAMQGNQADWGIRASNQHINHHMVKLFQQMVCTR